MPAPISCGKTSLVPGTRPSILAELGRGPAVEWTGVAGGCIADARVATFKNGSKVFVKLKAGKCAADAPGLFECEAQGLRALAAAGAIRVPQVLAVGEEALVLEMIVESPKKRRFSEDFGRRFAQLHGYRGKAFGFSNNNFIGSTRQRNDPLDGPWDMAADEDGAKWPAFFVERRLRFQARLAASRGYGDDLERLLDRAEARIIGLLSTAIELPSLLHGDLWSGNFIVDDRGEACLIDPAVYYGHREADLAMTRLFGGFEPSFYKAYEETSPLDAGHEERLGIYQLYHLLNHLNLFGSGYYGQSKRILQQYAS